LANSGISRIVYLRPYFLDAEKFEDLMHIAGIETHSYQPAVATDLILEEAIERLGNATDRPGQASKDD
jgi:hypothetical protein